MRIEIRMSTDEQNEKLVRATLVMRENGNGAEIGCDVNRRGQKGTLHDCHRPAGLVGCHVQDTALDDCHISKGTKEEMNKRSNVDG